jgi:tRNA threonylcarbamoyladenosine biosynthesis protein TsaE
MALRERVVTVASHSEEETVALGEQFLRDNASVGMVVALYGELGTGKTHFVKGMARALGIDERELTSPTYALANEYECKLPDDQPITLFHLDCYRFEKPDELLELGLEDYLQPVNAITVIEWAERIQKFLQAPRFDIQLTLLSDNERMITIKQITE